MRPVFGGVERPGGMAAGWGVTAGAEAFNLLQVRRIRAKGLEAAQDLHPRGMTDATERVPAAEDPRTLALAPTERQTS